MHRSRSGSRTLPLTGRDRLVAEHRRRRGASAWSTTAGRASANCTTAAKYAKASIGSRELGLTYEQDGALFFAATKFADDKDRVLLRSDGRPTYFSMDVAYHYQKLKTQRPRR